MTVDTFTEGGVYKTFVNLGFVASDSEEAANSYGLLGCRSLDLLLLSDPY